jgi:fimbrial chaperone protein
MRTIAVALTAVLVTAGSAAASTLGVSPVRVELSPSVGTAVLTVRNQEDTSVVVQARPAAWSQTDDHDQLDDTHDVLVTPPLFTLPPNGQQVLRVALLRKPDPARELAYRVVLSEVPPAASPDRSELRVALRITLPVFVTPAVHAAADLSWRHVWLPDGTLDIQAQNRGTAHLQILSFEAQSGENAHDTLHADTARYLLPDTTAHWRLAAGPAVDRTAHVLIHGHSDAGDFSVSSDPATH